MNSSVNIKDLPNGELILSFTIPSQPATKKNSSRIIKIKGFFKIIPSERFMNYQKFCGQFLNPMWKDKEPMDFGISVKIRVATNKWIIPDYTNVCQALGDILQHYKLISNDKWIHWTDGEIKENTPLEHWFIGIDKINPRLEVEIRRFRHPLEDRAVPIKTKSTKKQQIKPNEA